VAVPSLSRKTDEGLLPAMGELWKTGVPMKWSALHAMPRRVALPTYPFQRQRYWIERSVAATVPEISTPTSAASLEKSEPMADIPVRADAAAVEKLIDEQMRIMARQLEILRAVPMNGKHS
jgi:acyl transferase domain-containing protein